MKKGWHTYIIYGSLIFLVAALYKKNYFEMPQIYSPALMLFAVLCLFGGFVLSAISQQRLLKKFNLQINIRQSIAMEGLNIFGKYIPGKMWTVMGKVLYLAEKKKFPASHLSLLFLHAQIIGLWCGLLLGICGLWLNHALHFLSWVGLVILVLFTFLLFSNRIQYAALSVINGVLKKGYRLPSFEIIKTISVSPWFFATWILWGVGFLLLASSITDLFFPFSTIFCFPLAGTFGILVIFAPGGIGVRESIITAYLTLLKVNLPEALTIAAVSRLWFLAGEFFIFMAGYMAARKNGRTLDE